MSDDRGTLKQYLSLETGPDPTVIQEIILFGRCDHLPGDRPGNLA